RPALAPPSSAELPATRSSGRSSAVVVVVPVGPVTATGRGPAAPGALATARNPTSISDTTGTPLARAATRGGASGGTPGDTTTAHAARIFARSWRPTSTSTPASRRSSATAAPA